MYETKKYEPKVYLLQEVGRYSFDYRDKQVPEIVKIEYKNIQTLLDKRNRWYISNNIGDHIGQIIYYCIHWGAKGSYKEPVKATLTIKDEYGDTITRKEFLKLFEFYLKRHKLYPYNKPYSFRDGPVYGVHCMRGGWGYHRHLRTTQERRENSFIKHDVDAKEYGVKARGRRCGHNLPDSWDDYGRSDWGHRSWKRHRKHQWKVKK